MLRLKSILCCLMLLSLASPLGNAWAKKPRLNKDSVSAITLDVLRVEACAKRKGCVVAGGPMQVDLLDMAKDNIEYVNQVLLPERTRSLRLILGDNSTITVDGESVPLAVPSGKKLKLKGWKKAFPKEGGFLSNLKLKLNLKKQIVVKRKKVRESREDQQKKKGRRGKKKVSYVYSYKLKPVIRVRSAGVEALPENITAVVAVPGEETVLREGDDDLVVTIPAGAVIEPTVITAKKIENAFYELNPEGIKFIEPVTIAMSYRALFHREAGYTDDDLVILRNGIEFPSSIDIESETIIASTKEFSDWMTTVKIIGCGKLALDSDPEVIPSIMRNKLHWDTAADLMEHWLYPDTVEYIDPDTGEHNVYNNDVVYKRPDVTKYGLISDMFNHLKEKAYDNTLFDRTKEYLAEGLKRTLNDNGLPVIPYGGSFNHIEMELDSAGEIWHEANWDISHMFFPVEKAICNTLRCQYDRYKEQDEYVGAFGSSSVRVVASGQVDIDNNIAKITISKAGLYFRDSYDFNGGDNGDFAEEQFLGCWSTEAPYVSLNPVLFESQTCVCNVSFRKYNARETAFKNRRNFRIFTDPEEYTINTNQVLTYSIPENDPYVEEVISKNTMQYHKATFTIKGHYLPSELEFNLQDCFNTEKISYKSTEIKFSCEPLESGDKKGELRYGDYLYTFTVPIDPPTTCTNGGLYCGDNISDSALIQDDTLYNKSNTLYECREGFYFVKKEVCSNGCIVNLDGYNDECNDTYLPYINKVSPLTTTVGTTQDFTITGQNLPNYLVGNIQGTASHCEHISGSGDTVILRCEAGTVGIKRFFLKEERGGEGIAGSEDIYITVTEDTAVKITGVSPLTTTVGTTQDFTITGQNLPNYLVGNIQGTASHCEHISGSGDTVILRCEAGTVGTKRFFLKEERGGEGIAGSEDIYIEVTEASLYFPETNLYIPVTGYANTSSIYATTENAFKGDLIGQCTWYAYGRVIELVDKGYLPSAAKSRFESAFWGTYGRHAKNWPSMLGGNWYETTDDPLPMEKRKEGLLAVWVDSGYGHVGFVEEVSSDKAKYRLSDFNRGRDVKYRDRWYNFESRRSDLLLDTYPQFYDIANPNW